MLMLACSKPIVQILGTFVTKHMPEHPNPTPSLLARQHRTFVPILFPQDLPNTPR